MTKTYGYGSHFSIPSSEEILMTMKSWHCFTLHLPNAQHGTSPHSIFFKFPPLSPKKHFFPKKNNIITTQILCTKSKEQPNLSVPEKEHPSNNLNSSKPETEAGYRNISTDFTFALENENFAVLSSCLVGFVTGISVVLFNNGVRELRDFFWDGIPSRGASWLREEPIEAIWQRVILVPAFGGLIVGLLNLIRSKLEDSRCPSNNDSGVDTRSFFGAIVKAVSACVTLGTGNSLGPEGPSVEIGASVAKGVGNLFDRSYQRRVSLVAAGSAAGISSGFNAAVAGCFFAVESVLWPAPADSSLSLPNTTSMVILSAVIASIVSEVGLGSEPAFKVPLYDFRSPGELPLYLLLGVLCGLVSLSLSKCTSYMLNIVENAHESAGIPRTAFPVLGGLAVGLLALAYPEILYWGFENVDILLESRPFAKGLSADLLLQLVAVKILATSLCRASGLVGGYYAPSLFIGAATGTAYGKLISFAFSQSNLVIDLSILEVASPQAYGLVGMAATLAGVCQVPLTSVLLLFELTQDYRIVLPLLGAVGLSSWITSGQLKRKYIKESGNRDNEDIINQYKGKVPANQQSKKLSEGIGGLSYPDTQGKEDSGVNDLCEVESSLCMNDSFVGAEELERRILVSQAMRTRFVTVLMSTLLVEAVTLMLAEKQSCTVIVDDKHNLVGFLKLQDIQEFSRSTNGSKKEAKELMVSELCASDDKVCKVPWVAVPNMTVSSALVVMIRNGMSQVPVVSDHVEDDKGRPVGILDRECISITCRALATRESLQ